MIEALRSEYDDEYLNRLQRTMPHQTPKNQQKIRCSVCGKFYFVDEEIFEQLVKLMKYDLDNQVLCIDCDREYQNAVLNKK